MLPTMAMYIRYDCVIDTPLRALIERLDELSIYDASSGKFVPSDKLGALRDSMFINLQKDKPLPYVHAATVDTRDANEFPSDAAYGYYIYNGNVRISALQPLIWNGSQIVVTVDGQVVYAS